jgi:hypothetical protein
MQDSTGRARRHQGPSGSRRRLAVVATAAFGLSAAFTTIVSATVGGGVTSYTGDGEDNSVIGGDGADSMTGEGGDDFLQGMLGADVLLGGAGDDTLMGDPASVAFDDDLDGGDGNDELAGGGGADVLRGGPGNDVIGSIDFTRAGGADLVEHGDDDLDGGGGDDVLLGGPGDDSLVGGDGWDRLDGGEGADLLVGGAGSNALYGGDGDDRLEARNGVADRVECGPGADVAVLDVGDEAIGCETQHYPDTTAPDTRIPSGAKRVVRTSKPKARVAFTFTATEPGSTFTCSLDGGPFRSCTSPARHRLTRGKHVFKVRARDAAGLVDPTPATQVVVVKKRRR